MLCGKALPHLTSTVLNQHGSTLFYKLLSTSSIRTLGCASTARMGQLYSYSTATAFKQDAQKDQPEVATKEEIERLLQKHQVKGVSMPVRAEFVRETPLTTTDLENIDIHVYHRQPETFSDHIAYRSVKLLRFFADTFFRKRYVHRAIVLETVAGVPGMVAGMLCHMRSLRRMQHDNGWIEKLLHEAENERMHLMIWMSVTNPTRLERFIVTFVQGLFFNAYMVYYLLFPRTAHRFVGYLEEEAIVSYNAFAKEIQNGNIKNTPAPKVAIDYYNLDKNARLLDVVLSVRADEAAHRDANHNFADRIDAHKENLSPPPPK
ncbi:alternative oxidase domain-containing protein [Ditylenchus destructor]|nr:alternative oxidase domain-containing protein [Ditylenchus destructor]